MPQLVKGGKWVFGGERAYLALTKAFGNQVQPCPAGTVLNFD